MNPSIPPPAVNVFVAGGTGFVGRSPCAVLADRGHAVTEASRSPDPPGLPPGVAFLPGGDAMRLQPLRVGDLAPMLVDGVVDARHVGRVYRLGGPEALTFAELARPVRGVRLVVPVPLPVAAVGFGAAELLPWVPLGLDQYRVLRLDNTVAANDVGASASTRNMLRPSEHLRP